MKKMLISLMCLFLFLIIGEVGYYVFLYKNKDVQPQQNIQNEDKILPTVISTNQDVSISVPFAKIVEGLKYKLKLKQAGFIKATLREDIYEFSIRFVADETELPNNYKKENIYRGLLYFDYEDEPHGFMFTTEEMSILKVYKTKDGSLQPISLKDLEKGDRVKVTYVSDIFKDSSEPAEKIEIVKL